jgi:hypothetical protein
MPKGSLCPYCNKKTFHDSGSLSTCSVCGAVGWSWRKEVSKVGKGKGNKCPNCANQTLHSVGSLSSGQIVRRCGTCDYSLIEPY